jgi:hypothetical protein
MSKTKITDVSEIRLSLLSKDEDTQAHTRHVAVEIHDSTLCALIAKAIDPLLPKCACKNEKTGKYDPECELCDGSGDLSLEDLPDAHKLTIGKPEEPKPKKTTAA